MPSEHGLLSRGEEKRMGIKTEIPYCDSTVNELVGCDGCCLHQRGKPESHCYAAGLVGRYAGLPGWPPTFDTPTVIPGRLAKAIKWPDLTGKERPEKSWLNGYPRIIFVSDVSDPFTVSVDPDSWLTPALPAMADSPHIYILLSKRGRRMLEYWQRHPIPRNVWPGVTVTGPDTAKRLDYLLQVPGASVRFASLEPLLGPVDLDYYTWDEPVEVTHDLEDAPDGARIGRFERVGMVWEPILPRLDWAIVGAESGSGARPMLLEWPRTIRDQCKRGGARFFMKQIIERGRKIPLAQFPPDLQIQEMPEC